VEERVHPWRCPGVRHRGRCEDEEERRERADEIIALDDVRALELERRLDPACGVLQAGLVLRVGGQSSHDSPLVGRSDESGLGTPERDACATRGSMASSAIRCSLAKWTSDIATPMPTPS